MDTKLPPDIACLSFLGCADELDRLLQQIKAIAITLTYAANEVSCDTVEGSCWAISDLTSRCEQIKQRAWQLMPRTE
ncbi:hypothetical protein [Microbulbifer discodermiae]|uniref:hypothetical protein n=1 Tax=Microbulbifer sp. 2201CG32-9 TaxID=3232309 RepID=UPI00345B936F